MDIVLAFAGFAALLAAWGFCARSHGRRVALVPVEVPKARDAGDAGFLRSLGCYP